MTVSEGVSVAEQFRNDPPEPSRPSSTLSRISSRLTISSVASFLHRSEYSGPLSHLCQLISKHSALYYATIISTDATLSPFVLDRRPSDTLGTLGLVGAVGSTPANDAVRSRSRESTEMSTKV